MLASSDPIHVTSPQHDGTSFTGGCGVTPGDARCGKTRMWWRLRRCNLIADHRSLIAQGEISVGRGFAPSERAEPHFHTALTQPVSLCWCRWTRAGGDSGPHHHPARLNYADGGAENFPGWRGDPKGSDATMTGEQMTVFLLPRSQSKAGRTGECLGKWSGLWPKTGVVITQPTRHATSDRCVYTAAEDKFVLTGGPPSIF